MKKGSPQILVVEDDVDLCNAMIKALRNAGYATTGALELREAMFRLKNQKYSCLLVDIQLGLDNGEELISFARERADQLNTETPIIVISGHLDRPLLGKIAKQIQGALVKPFEMKALLEVVKTHI